MAVRTFSLFILFLSLVSCNAYKLDNAQNTLRSSFARRNYTGSVELLSKLEHKKVYKSKDAVLLNLEQGTANHFAGNFEESNDYFTAAEDRIDYLYTKSISRAIQSFVVNDNALAYDGEDYEDVYLNIFKALNYIHMDKLEEALVESRRITHKLSQLDMKYQGLVKALSKADTTEQAQWYSGNTNVQNSALGRYLSAVLFAKTNKPDDARIEFQNLLKAFNDQPSVYTFQLPSHAELRRIIQPDRYNVLVICFSGRAPRKVQNDLRAYLEEPDLYLKFSLPSLQMYYSRVRSVEVSVNDDISKKIPVIEDMDEVAREVYKVKEPIIYARTMVRALLKAVGSNQLSHEIKKKNKTLGGVTNLLGKIGQETTEKADLRGWQILPGKACTTVLNLPPGEHEVTLHFYGNNGLLFSETKTITVSGPQSLELVESLYWN